MVTDESLHGRIVLSADGVAIGEIARLLIDPAGWQIRGLEVRVRKEAADRIGVPHGLFRAHTIEISTAQVQSIGDVVILSVPLEALRALRHEQAPQPSAQH